jgi:hypothetical protein
MKEIIIIAYLIGSVLSYFIFRTKMKQSFGLWTIGDRKWGLFFSLFSYVSILAFYISGAFKEEDNRPAKW